jgi:hypothetical protein
MKRCPRCGCKLHEHEGCAYEERKEQASEEDRTADNRKLRS